MESKTIRIILDTDIGDDIDDALALALAVNSPEIEILCVTTVFRNTEARARLTKKMLKVMGREDIPVVPGTRKPLVDAPVDTLFDTIDENELPGQYSQDMDNEIITTDENAVDFMIRVLESSAEPITLVPIGPLTNIALVLSKNPSIKNKISRIVLMGGAYNMNLSEYNILCDPEAAKIVFESGIDIIGVGLDVTTKCQFTEEEVVRIRERGTPVNQLLTQLIDRFMSYAHHLPYLHDPLAVAVAINPELVNMERKRIGVECKGQFTRGMTFNISNTRWWEKHIDTSLVQICSEVDRDKSVAFILNRILK